jgi:hypothetical protein
MNGRSPNCLKADNLRPPTNCGPAAAHAPDADHGARPMGAVVRTLTSAAFLVTAYVGELQGHRRSRQ